MEKWFLFISRYKKNLKKFLRYKHEIFFVGHTHRKHIHKFKNKTIYNPGSIGQPRDGIKGINWHNLIHFQKKLLFIIKLIIQLKLSKK